MACFAIRLLKLRPTLLLAPSLFMAACSRPAPRSVVASPAPDPITAIVGPTIWDGTGRAPVADAVVLIRGDRILCAGSAVECIAPAHARMIEAQGRWLIPGLIDSHVHLLFAHAQGDELALDLRDLLAQGVTAVRDMGTDAAMLLARTRVLPSAPRIYAMQLVAGQGFFFTGMRAIRTERGTEFHQPPALSMLRLGWLPFVFRKHADADSLVRESRATGAIGLKLYAQLDAESVRRLTEAGHRAGMPVWGHAWVQPASVLEQALAGQDGVVHAAGLAGELYSHQERDTLVADGALQMATAAVATVDAAHDPRVAAVLDSLAKRGTFLEPTLDATRRSVWAYDTQIPHTATIQERYVRAAAGFGMEVTREAVRRGVRISAGSDHVAYGPARERATLFGELELLVDSISLSPAAALLAATRDAAAALGEPMARQMGTIEAGRYADLVLVSKNPLDDIRNLESVEWVMKGGTIWRPGQLRSGIALR